MPEGAFYMVGNFEEARAKHTATLLAEKKAHPAPPAAKAPAETHAP